MTERTTAEWVCASYPDRVRNLLEQLDLARAGLQDVKAAVANGDSVGACKALLEYYRTCDSGKWLRWEKLPPAGVARDKGADAIRIRVHMPEGKAVTVRIPWRRGTPVVEPEK